MSLASDDRGWCFLNHARANKAWCVLKSHRLLAGESPVLVTIRRPGSRQPVHLGD